MTTILLTPYQAAVLFAALSMWCTETEITLHANTFIDEDKANTNNMLTLINSTIEAEIMKNQIKEMFDIVENEDQ